MSVAVDQAANVMGPYGGSAQSTDPSGTRLACVDITTGSQDIDLSTSTYFNNKLYQSHIVDMVCESAVYYFWSNTASETVDETAKGATQRGRQAFRLPADSIRSERPSGRYLHVKGAAAGTLRIAISDRV